MPAIKSGTTADAQLIVASSEQNADLLYATRFFAPDPFILLIHRGRKHLVMSDLEIDRARKQAEVHSIRARSELESELRKHGRQITTSAVVKLFLSRVKVRSVVVPYDFPTGLAFAMRKHGFKVIPKQAPFFSEREIKDPAEIRHIAAAQRAAEAGMRAGIELIRQARINSRGWLLANGSRLTAEKVKQRINGVVLSHGYTAVRTIVAGGEQGCDPHDEGSGPLRGHTPIILDVFPRSQRSGYWGDITRTVVRGRAGERLKAIFEAVKSGQALALRQIRAGARGAAIHQSILDHFRKSGFETGIKDGRMQGFFHGTGHGVGLEIHEFPRIGSTSSSILKKGHVVTVEPGLYYPGVGGVRIEDLVVVTKEGYRNLTRFFKNLEI